MCVLGRWTRDRHSDRPLRAARVQPLWFSLSLSLSPVLSTVCRKQRKGGQDGFGWLFTISGRNRRRVRFSVFFCKVRELVFSLVVASLASKEALTSPSCTIPRV